MLTAGRRQAWVLALVVPLFAAAVQGQADLPACEVCMLRLFSLHHSTSDTQATPACHAALQGHKIYVLDLGMFAEEHGMMFCDIDSTFRVDPITNVPYLHDDPQVIDKARAAVCACRCS